jgi:hypothetical protein
MKERSGGASCTRRKRLLKACGISELLITALGFLLDLRLLDYSQPIRFNRSPTLFFVRR